MEGSGSEIRLGWGLGEGAEAGLSPDSGTANSAVITWTLLLRFPIYNVETEAMPR